MTQIKTVCVDKVAYDAVLRNSIRVNYLEAENKQLRQLLKECRDDYVSTDLDDDLLLNQDMARDLVTRINAVIGEK